jgi:hypothetical protein
MNAELQNRLKWTLEAFVQDRSIRVDRVEVIRESITEAWESLEFEPEGEHALRVLAALTAGVLKAEEICHAPKIRFDTERVLRIIDGGRTE